MFNKILKYYFTLKFLTFKQLFFLFIYRFFKRRRLINSKICYEINNLNFHNHIINYSSFQNNEFEFIGLKKKFDVVDWNYSEFGNLWTYNLNYFDFLNQKDISKNEGVNLINQFIGDLPNINIGLDSYPLSLRGINWIKFLTKYKIQNNEINASLFLQYKILIKNLEYHLLANHLLENGFSLLFAAYYFKNYIFYNKAEKLIISQLNEQILNDGAHFEQSPMYQQILLYRLLDSINLISNNNIFNNEEFFDFLKNKACLMLSWLINITYNNGEIPLVNDSSKGIAPSTKELIGYAELLNIYPKKIQLSDSGYRMIRTKYYESFIDIGTLTAKYQPGHSHSDIFNFELRILNKPIFVDTGISTYEKNKTRQIERSTVSHNTVQYKNIEPIEVWGGFRVARRAKVKVEIEKNGIIKAKHNGFRKYGIAHSREFIYKNNEFIIIDSLIGNTNENADAYFHLHNNVNFILKDNAVTIKNAKIIFHNAESIKINKYYLALGFNNLIESKTLIVSFKEKLKTQIIINENINN